ncbi:hypothetical protein, partial [Catenovulum agarivorans]|uniref:hypothetical protein n=1 Tax=Catenovulum agarivorans TaxID=1172192 RepID=UPI00058F4FAD
KSGLGCRLEMSPTLWGHFNMVGLFCMCLLTCLPPMVSLPIEIFQTTCPFTFLILVLLRVLLPAIKFSSWLGVKSAASLVAGKNWVLLEKTR